MLRKWRSNRHPSNKSCHPSGTFPPGGCPAHPFLMFVHDFSVILIFRMIGPLNQDDHPGTNYKPVFKALARVLT